MLKRLTVLIVLAFSLVLAACQGGGGGTTRTPAGGASPGGGASPEGTEAAELPTGPNVEQIQETGTLRCGVKFDVLAFGFNNPETGEVEGLDADLCREIAAAMEVEPEFIEAISANRIPFLQEDTVDLVISTMTVTEERKQEIDFSHVYYVAGQSILVPEDSDIQSVDDLAGRVVCSGEGSTSEANLRERGVAEEDLRLYATYTEAAQAMVDGICEAVSTDNTILFGLAEQFEGTKLVGGEFTEEPLGIGIKKDREDLVEFVNAVLEQMRDDGRLTALYEEWITPYTDETPEPPF